jgi:hypothetical protein
MFCCPQVAMPLAPSNSTSDSSTPDETRDERMCVLIFLAPAQARVLVVHPDNASSGSERDFVRLKEARKVLDDSLEQRESASGNGGASGGGGGGGSESYGRVHVVRPE